jgi:hypothetical protein
MDISSLITDLAAKNVASFEGYGIKITFHKRSAEPQRSIVSDVQAPIPPQSSQQPSIDPALAQTMDAEMPFDKILNWSTQSADEPETPLTGDSAPLTTEV